MAGRVAAAPQNNPAVSGVRPTIICGPHLPWLNTAPIRSGLPHAQRGDEKRFLKKERGRLRTLALCAMCYEGLPPQGQPDSFKEQRKRTVKHEMIPRCELKKFRRAPAGIARRNYETKLDDTTDETRTEQSGI
jgi:hypothetical protein